MLAKSCRLCGCHSLHEGLSINNSPNNVQSLLKIDDLPFDKPIRLEILVCDRCGLVQIDPLLDKAYYDDYLMSTTYSNQMQVYQRQQAKMFVEKFGLHGKAVKEIGCGDGSYLDHLSEAGALPSGIEPSNRFRKLALARGYLVEDGYLTASRLLEGGLSDGFVARQVLEHVPNIHDFLTGIRTNLKPEGVGLIEVPSLEKALTDHRFYDFFPDHVNYFSLRTLRLALEINGFEVLEAHHGMFDEYNVALVKKSSSPDLIELNEAIHSLGRDLRKFIEQYHSSGRKVAIWGAGGKGLSVLAAAGIKNVDLLIDGDPFKVGSFTPVSHLKIETPSALNKANISAVVITAMAYRHEIEKIITDELLFKGDIAILGKRELILLKNKN